MSDPNCLYCKNGTPHAHMVHLVPEPPAPLSQEPRRCEHGKYYSEECLSCSRFYNTDSPTECHQIASPAALQSSRDQAALSGAVSQEPSVAGRDEEVKALAYELLGILHPQFDVGDEENEYLAKPDYERMRPILTAALSRAHLAGRLEQREMVAVAFDKYEDVTRDGLPLSEWIRRLPLEGQK